MNKKFDVHVSNEIIAKANAADLELPMPEKNSVTMDVRAYAIPDRTGVCLGKDENGVLKSYLKNDEDGTKLRKYIDAELVTMKTFCQRINNELVDVPHYFFMYEIDDSTANRPTYTEDSCGYATPISGHYGCEYEILLGSEGYTRRMLFRTQSVNVSMYEWLKDLEDELDDLEYAPDDIKDQFYTTSESGSDGDDDGFGDDDADGSWMFTMFDEVGLPTEIEFDKDEFLSMIVGIRQLSCVFVDDGEKNV